MLASFLTGLLLNTAILLSFSMLYDNYWVRYHDKRGMLSKLVIGIIIGIIGIILMLTPWKFMPGVTFDTRSVMLGISGLFFGPVPTVVAMIIDIFYRWSMGGDGVWMGMAVIMISGSTGIVWRKFRPKWKEKNTFSELFYYGFVDSYPDAFLHDFFARRIVSFNLKSNHYSGCFLSIFLLRFCLEYYW
jgi:hypothetical protein